MRLGTRASQPPGACGAVPRPPVGSFPVGKRENGPRRLPGATTHRQGQQRGHAAWAAAQQEGPALFEWDVSAHLLQKQLQDLRSEAGLHRQRPPEDAGVAAVGREDSHLVAAAGPSSMP